VLDLTLRFAVVIEGLSRCALTAEIDEGLMQSFL